MRQRDAGDRTVRLRRSTGTQEGNQNTGNTDEQEVERDNKKREEVTAK